jgi:hypothetical protein
VSELGSSPCGHTEPRTVLRCELRPTVVEACLELILSGLEEGATCRRCRFALAATVNESLDVG